MKTRHSILLLFILVICVGIGFSFGAYPRFWNKLTGRSSKTILLLISDQQNLPPGFADTFFSETGYDLQIQEIKTPNLFLADSKNATVLYAPWEWLESVKNNLQTWPDGVWSQLYPDFQSSDFFAQKFFPLFWTLQPKADGAKKQFHFEGFATFDSDIDGARLFVQFLLQHPDLLKTWTLQKKMGSTLQEAANWSDFPNELKPQAVRENPLAGISTKEEPASAVENPKKSKK